MGYFQVSGQSYKHFTLVNYDSRVVIYERRGFIRLATACWWGLCASRSFSNPNYKKVGWDFSFGEIRTGDYNFNECWISVSGPKTRKAWIYFASSRTKFEKTNLKLSEIKNNLICWCWDRIHDCWLMQFLLDPDCMQSRIVLKNVIYSSLEPIYLQNILTYPLCKTTRHT